MLAQRKYRRKRDEKWRRLAKENREFRIQFQKVAAAAAASDTRLVQTLLSSFHASEPGTLEAGVPLHHFGGNRTFLKTRTSEAGAVASGPSGIHQPASLTEEASDIGTRADSFANGEFRLQSDLRDPAKDLKGLELILRSIGDRIDRLDSGWLLSW